MPLNTLQLKNFLRGVPLDTEDNDDLVAQGSLLEGAVAEDGDINYLIGDGNPNDLVAENGVVNEHEFNAILAAVPIGQMDRLNFNGLMVVLGDNPSPSVLEAFEHYFSSDTDVARRQRSELTGDQLVVMHNIGLVGSVTRVFQDKDAAEVQGLGPDRCGAPELQEHILNGLVRSGRLLNLPIASLEVLSAERDLKERLSANDLTRCVNGVDGGIRAMDADKKLWLVSNATLTPNHVKQMYDWRGLDVANLDQVGDDIISHPLVAPTVIAELSRAPSQLNRLNNECKKRLVENRHITSQTAKTLYQWNRAEPTPRVDADGIVAALPVPPAFDINTIPDEILEHPEVGKEVVAQLVKANRLHHLDPAKKVVLLKAGALTDGKVVKKLYDFATVDQAALDGIPEELLENPTVARIFARELVKNNRYHPPGAVVDVGAAPIVLNDGQKQIIMEACGDTADEFSKELADGIEVNLRGAGEVDGRFGRIAAGNENEYLRVDQLAAILADRKSRKHNAQAIVRKLSEEESLGRLCDGDLDRLGKAGGFDGQSDFAREAFARFSDHAVGEREVRAISWDLLTNKHLNQALVERLAYSEKEGAKHIGMVRDSKSSSHNSKISWLPSKAVKAAAKEGAFNGQPDVLESMGLSKSGEKQLKKAEEGQRYNHPSDRVDRRSSGDGPEQGEDARRSRSSKGDDRSVAPRNSFNPKQVNHLANQKSEMGESTKKTGGVGLTIGLVGLLVVATIVLAPLVGALLATVMFFGGVAALGMGAMAAGKKMDNPTVQLAQKHQRQALRSDMDISRITQANEMSRAQLELRKTNKEHDEFGPLPSYLDTQSQAIPSSLLGRG